MTVLAVGTVALDTIETPFGKAERVLGGSATYFAAAAGFYTDVDVVAVVGGDLPMESLDFLRKRRTNLDGVQVREDGTSFFWSGRYHHDLNTRDTLTTDLNVLADFDPVVPQGRREPAYAFLANIDPVLQNRVLDQIERPRFVAMDTMNYWIDGSRKALDEVIQRVDCIVLNDEEAREYAEDPSLVKAARYIQDAGPRVVVIKKGEHGALLFNGDRVFAAPAYPLEEVVDPTGAGDTFAGGFIGYIAACGSTEDGILRKAIVKGSALASHCVEAFGTERLQNLRGDEVLERARRFEGLTTFESFA